MCGASAAAGVSEEAFAVQTQDGKPGDTVLQTPHSRCVLLDVGEPAPPGFDLVVVLADGRRLAYEPALAGPDSGAELVPDPLLRGNAFLPVHESDRSLAAFLSIAASRRVATGPESERIVVIFRGVGMVFLENEDLLKFEPGTVLALPPGDPARVWSQGPDDVLAAVLQPKGVTAPRRTLASEIAKRRSQAD